MTNDRKYHHGDLRSVLLTEAKRILAEESVDGLTLRKLADRAGVSRAAPYHHFKDKHALLCAIAADGFRELDALMAAHPLHQAERSSLSGLLQDYLRFANTDPERYELMFGRRIWKLSEPTAELREVAYATFRRYVSMISQMNQRSGSTLDAKRTLRVAQASWATLHGLSHLTNDGIYVDLEDMAEVSQIAIDMLLKSVTD